MIRPVRNLAALADQLAGGWHARWPTLPPTHRSLRDRVDIATDSRLDGFRLDLLTQMVRRRLAQLQALNREKT